MVEIAEGGDGEAVLTTPRDTTGRTVALVLIGSEGGGGPGQVGTAAGAAPGEEITIGFDKPAPGRYRVEVKTTADESGGSSEEEGLLRGTMRIVDYESIP